jgi:hypothetical protein
MKIYFVSVKTVAKNSIKLNLATAYGMARSQTVLNYSELFTPIVNNLFRKLPDVQGCQIVYFQTKNRHSGTFWRVLHWKMVYFMAIWSILRPLDIFYGHLVHFVVIWYISIVLVYCTRKNLATLPDAKESCLIYFNVMQE